MMIFEDRDVIEDELEDLNESFTTGNAIEMSNYFR
jgi:hypothetical protein